MPISLVRGWLNIAYPADSSTIWYTLRVACPLLFIRPWYYLLTCCIFACTETLATQIIYTSALHTPPPHPHTHYPQIENSINGDEARSDERRVAVRCPGGYAENDNVLVWYGKGKSLKTYQVCLVLLTLSVPILSICSACACVYSTAEWVVCIEIVHLYKKC